MGHLYNFGLSQEDPATEATALDLGDSDRVLSVSSAGDMPLSLLALGAKEVHAVDIDRNQLELSRLKASATCALDAEEAMRFLGFMPASAGQRRRWLATVSRHLPPTSTRFWATHRRHAVRGAIWAGRFERYIRRFAPLLVRLLGRRRIIELFECRTLADQRRHFDRTLDRRRVRWLFEIAFNERLFRKRGMDPRSLQHRNAAQSVAEQYFGTFRQLCTGTPARENHLLQVMLLGHVLSMEATPIYLSPGRIEIVRERISHLHFHESDLEAFICDCAPGTFNKVHLSNVPDWLDQERFEAVLQALSRHCDRPGRLVWRYLHIDRSVPAGLAENTVVDRALGNRLRLADRFPFYGIVPAILPIERSS